MNTILDSLNRLSPQALGTIVHIGAGRGDHLAGYAALAPHSLVLVEGDPDTFAELQAAAKGMTGIALRGEVVAAVAGDVTWHRYNLRALNGTPDVSTALRAAYPRLALQGMQPVAAVGIAELLVSLTPSFTDTGPAVLVLDTPGQEAGLLAALPAELLRAFGWLVVRRCREPLGAQAAAPAELPAWLAAQHFGPAGGDADSEPLWPVTVWRFDRLRFELEQWRERYASLEAQLAGGATQLNAALAAGQALTADKADLVEQRDGLTKERSTLVAENAGLAAEKARLLAERDKLTAEKADLVGQRDGMIKERSTLTAARDEQAKLAAERHKRITALEAETVDLKARRQMLQDELAKVELQVEFIKDLLLREPAL